MNRKLLISLALTLWILGAFVGRWGLMTSSVPTRVINERSDDSGGTIDRSGWMRFGLAVHEMCYEGAAGASRETTSGNGSLNSRGYALVSRKWNIRLSLTATTSNLVSSKKLIEYYVFALCKLLD